MQEEDIKNGKFVDDQGREQIVVPLSSIFKMVGGTSPQQQQPTVPKVHPEPQEPPVKKKPTTTVIKRGIKLPK